MPRHRRCFTITGRNGTIECLETRERASSAMVLADRWAAAGFEAVTITDPEGVRRTRKHFRLTLPGIRTVAEL